MPTKRRPNIIHGTFGEIAIRLHPITPGMPAILMVFSLPKLSIIIPLNTEENGITTIKTLAKIEFHIFYSY